MASVLLKKCSSAVLVCATGNSPAKNGAASALAAWMKWKHSQKHSNKYLSNYGACPQAAQGVGLSAASPRHKAVHKTFSCGLSASIPHAIIQSPNIVFNEKTFCSPVTFLFNHRYCTIRK